MKLTRREVDSPAGPSAPQGQRKNCQPLRREAAPVPAAGAGVGQLIAAGPVRAGVGEVRLDLPVGTPLGGYTARMRLLGGEAPDSRQSPHARAFYPSVGVQTRPQVRALYLQAGSEPLLVLKADLCLSYDRLVFDVEKTLAGEGLLAPRGHVMVATSHTHAGPGNYHGAFHLTLGLDMFDEGQYQRLLASLLTAARAAIQSAAPARIGVGVWDGWDKNDEIYSDRRDDDDGFLGPDGKPVGKHKEQRLFVLRVDKADGKPLAIVESFPIHGTVAGDDNPLISVEAPGHVELDIDLSWEPAPGATRAGEGPGVVVAKVRQTQAIADGVPGVPACYTVTLPAGKAVFTYGEPGDSMFIVRSGAVEISFKNDTGDKIVLETARKGDFFGETTLIEMQPRPFTAVAEQPARVLELRSAHLYALYQRDVHAYVMVLQNINRELCRRLRRRRRRSS